MKETEFHPKDETNKIEQQQISKEELFRVEKLQAGHTMFEVNVGERTCVPAKYESTTVDFDGNIKRKLVVKHGCLYISALNERNARRKLLQRMFKHAQSKK